MTETVYKIFIHSRSILHLTLVNRLKWQQTVPDIACPSAAGVLGITLVMCHRTKMMFVAQMFLVVISND